MGTYAGYLAAGSGTTAYRLVIEGCKYIFVTDEQMECTMDDRRIVVRGLSADDISIDESAIIPTCELSVRLSSLQIMETDGPNANAATAAFTSFVGVPLAFLGAALSAGAASASMTSAAALTVDQIIHVGTEALRVTSITPSGTTAPDTIGVSRGMWDTTAQGFATAGYGPGGVFASPVGVFAVPPQFAGRRVWLYGHGDSELALDTASTTTTGTLLWRGVLQSNPEMSEPLAWSLSCEPRLALFDADIGKGIGGAAKIRGVYYSATSPLLFIFQKRSGLNRGDAFVAQTVVVFRGFYETQAEHCAALAAQLNADPTLSTWGATWAAVPITRPDGTETWDLQFVVGSFWIDVTGGSHVDGYFNGAVFPPTTPSSTPTLGLSSVVSGSRYVCGWVPDDTIQFSRNVPASNLRAVPRASYMPLLTGVTPSTADMLSYPPQRFYLDFASAIAGWGSAKLTPPTPEGTTTAAEPIDVTGLIYAAAGYIEVPITTTVPPFSCAGDYGATFDLAAIFGGITGCNLAEFIAAVIADAPANANTGSTPFITNDDVADWTAVVVAAIAGDAQLNKRVFSFTKTKKFIDVVREECKLLGIYLVLDSAGKVAVKPLPAIDATTPTLTIDDDRVTPGDDFGLAKLSPDGIITSIELKGGYIAADDKWQTTWTFQATGGTAQTKSKGQPLTIAPFARPYVTTPDAGDLPITVAESRVQRLMSVFGVQYTVIDVPVDMVAHSARIGDVVLATIPQLPFAGSRGGLANTRCFVIGRKFMYGAEPGGTLRLLAIAVNGAGYAPSCKITSATGAGTVWSLTAAAVAYGPGTVADASFFVSGYRICLCEHDAESPVRILGTVTSVVGNVIGVTLDSAWSGIGAAPWYQLDFAASNEGVVAEQRAFCFWGDPTGRIAYSDGTSDPARSFA